jgi:hypothetical protein
MLTTKDCISESAFTKKTSAGTYSLTAGTGENVIVFVLKITKQYQGLGFTFQQLFWDRNTKYDLFHYDGWVYTIHLMRHHQ